ncbi:MAG: hypothetical protein WCI45_00145 [Desulfuromonadales bacterium]
MRTDARMLFIVKALHCVVECGESLDSDEIEGLKVVLESVVIDERGKHDGL